MQYYTVHLQLSLDHRIHSTDVNAGQAEPREGELSVGVVLMELDVQEEIPSVEEKEGSRANSVFCRFNLKERVDR